MITEEPIKRIQKIAEDGGLDGSKPLESFYGQLLLGIRPEVADLPDEEAMKALTDFRHLLKADMQPNGDPDPLDIFCLDIRPSDTLKTNENLRHIHDWCALALDELETKNEVGAGWVSPAMIS